MTTRLDKRHGYSVDLRSAVLSREDSSLASRFAKVCIETDVSVQKVADLFCVSRQTVYSWFVGASRPRPRHEEKMRNLLASPEELRA
jgi:hypothetical protein